MQVLLLQNVKNLGSRGEIKEVSDGYARNFLIPNKLAEASNDRAVSAWKQQETKKMKAAEMDLKQAQSLASRLDGREIVITAKAGADGKLYGGISAAAIVTALGKEGFKIDKKHVVLPEQIKTIGEHPVIIKLGHRLEVEITVVVEET